MRLKLKISLNIIPLIIIILIGFNILFYNLYVHYEHQRNQSIINSYLENNMKILVDDLIEGRDFIRNLSSALLSLSSFYDFDIAIVDSQNNPIISTVGYDIFYSAGLPKYEKADEGLTVLKTKREKQDIRNFYSFKHNNKSLLIYMRFSNKIFNINSVYYPFITVILIQSLILFIMIIMIINSSIIKPLNALEKMSGHITNSEFDKTVDYSFKRDELGNLYDRMCIMRSSLKETQENLIKKIEDLKNANILLSKTQHQLIISERFSLIGKLSSSIAHEIGNPLNGITGYLDLLRIGRLTEKEILEYIDGIELEINRIQNLIYSLLDSISFSRINIGSFYPVREIRDILNILLISKEFKDKSINASIAVQCSEDFEINQYREFFRHIVFNILHNAFKFSGIDSKVKINIDKDEQKLKISVRDYGAGIMDNNKENIFESGTSDNSGTGLGLYLSKIFAEYMQGELIYNQPEGKGSIFTLFIPVCLEGKK